MSTHANIKCRNTALASSNSLTSDINNNNNNNNNNKHNKKIEENISADMMLRTTTAAVKETDSSSSTIYTKVKLRPSRVALPREAVNPFYYNSDLSDTLVEKIKLILFGFLFLLPLRIIYILLLLLFIGIISVIDSILPVSYQSWSKSLLRFIIRWITLAFGYWRINRVHVNNYSLQPDGSHAEAPIIIANHCTMQDSLFIIGEHDVYPIFPSCYLSTTNTNTNTINTNSNINNISRSIGSMLVRMLVCSQQELLYENSVETEIELQPRVRLQHTSLEANNNNNNNNNNNMNSYSDSQNLLKGIQKKEKEEKEEKEKEDLYNKRNTYNRPILIFPEVCYTNGRTLIQFNPHPAFISAMPIQPIILRYPYSYFDPSWCSLSSPWWIVLIKTMSQLYNSVEITYLPVYHPSKEEVQNPQYFAENVHHLMARYMKIPETAHNNNDIRLLCLAHNILKLPVDAINVETAHPHFAIIPYKRMEHMLRRFANILYINREKESNNNNNNKKRYRRRLPEGFMTPEELGEFLTPMKYYPILLERLLYHLSRRALVRGMYITFRDFLSAMHTEPILINKEKSIKSKFDKQEESMALYIDEMELDVDITAVLRRTFAMMLLSSHALLVQQREYNENNMHIDKTTAAAAAVVVPSLSILLSYSSSLPNASKSDNNNIDNNNNINSDIPITAIDIAITMAADDSLHEQQLCRDAFNVLLDILFIPHQSTKLGGASRKSLEQLKEENALFSYIQSGATSHVTMEIILKEKEREKEKEEYDIHNKAEEDYKDYNDDDVVSNITLHGFLRFGRKHRDLAEYFHACCEHFLFGDDLA